MGYGALTAAIGCLVLCVGTRWSLADGHGQDIVVNCSTPAVDQYCQCLESGDGRIRTLFCLDPDLRAIPQPIPSETNSIKVDMTGLTALNTGDFAGVAASLDELSLTSNQQLSRISPLAFRGMTSLYSLTISNCNLSSLDEHVFNPLTNLTTLNLNTNFIRTIVPCQFQRLARLQKIDLSNNFIQSLPSGTFANLHQLRELILDTNQLTRLLPETFFLLPNTTIANLGISIVGNPFNCDCNTLWLHWLLTDASNRDPFLNTPTCAMPEKVKDQPFDGVDRMDLCSYRPPKVLLEKNSVTRGQTTSLTCTSFVSSRKPLYHWYKDDVFQASFARKTESRYHVFYGLLTIENVTDADAGTWWCHVTDPQLGSFQKSETIDLNVHGSSFCGHPVPSTSDSAQVGQWIGIAFAIVATVLICAVGAYCIRKRRIEMSRIKEDVRKHSSISNLPRNMYADESFGLAENPEYLRYLKQTSRGPSQSSGIGAVSYQKTDGSDKPAAPQPQANALSHAGFSKSSVDRAAAARFGMDRGDFGVPRVVENPLVVMGYTQSDFQDDDRESLATTTLNRSAAPTDPDGEWSGIADQSAITYLSNNTGAEEGPEKKVPLKVFNEF